MVLKQSILKCDKSTFLFHAGVPNNDYFLCSKYLIIVTQLTSFIVVWRHFATYEMCPLDWLLDFFNQAAVIGLEKWLDSEADSCSQWCPSSVLKSFSDIIFTKAQIWSNLCLMMIFTSRLQHGQEMGKVSVLVSTIIKVCSTYEGCPKRTIGTPLQTFVLS